MKKRRELDALVNGSKQSSGARVKNGRHELLRNESESSEIEEFSLTPNTAARKRTRCHCCSMCWPVCSAFLLVLCISFVAVLVWMNIQLKNEVYQLQNHLHEVQVSVKDIPLRVDKINQKQQTLQKSFNYLTTQGERDVPKLRSAVSALSLQVSAINASLIPLIHSPTIVSQTTIQELQSHYDQLSHNFADIGSRVQALEKEQVQQKQRVSNIVSSLLNTTPSPSDGSSSDSNSAAQRFALEEIQRISVELGNVNSSLRGQLDRLIAETSARQSMLVNLYNQTLSLESRLKVLQEKWTSGGLPPAVHAVITSVVNTEVTSRLQESSHTDANNSLSSAVEEMKELFDARMLTLELHNANQTKSIASIAAELNFTKEALNHATSNITDSVQLLSQTIGSIAVRLQAVENAVSDLQNHNLKPTPSATTAVAPPASLPTAIVSSVISGKVDTSSPIPAHSNANAVNAHGGAPVLGGESVPGQHVPSPNSRRRPLVGQKPVRGTNAEDANDKDPLIE